MLPRDPVARIWLGATAVPLALSLDLLGLLVLIGVLVASLLQRPAARRSVWWAGRFLALAVAFIVAVNGLIYPEAKRSAVVLGITVYPEGLQFAATVSCRLAAITLAQLYMLGGDPLHLVTQALLARGMSPRIGFLLLYTVTTMRSLRRRWRTVIDAQCSRGMVLRQRPLARMRALVPVIGPVAMTYLAESVERSMILELKGFGRRGPKSTVIPSPQAGIASRLGPWVFLGGVAVLFARVLMAIR